MMADVARCVCVETEVAMEQEETGIVVKLMAAEPALKAQSANGRLVGVEIQRGHVASNFRNPVAEIDGATGHGRMRILIAAIEGEPMPGREFEIERHTAAFDLAEVFAQQKNGRRGWIGGDGNDGAVDLGEEVAGTDGAPVAFRGHANLPTGGALAEQAAAG